MRLRRTIVLVGTLFAGMVPQAGVAQDSPLPAQSECGCVLPTVPVGSGVGFVESVRGEVLMSMAAGYGKVATGAPIVSGSRIVVGADSSASLRFGSSCTLRAPSWATVLVTARQAGTCIAVKPVTTASQIDNILAPLDDLAQFSLTPIEVWAVGLGLSGVAVSVDMGRDNPLSR